MSPTKTPPAPTPGLSLVSDATAPLQASDAAAKALVARYERQAAATRAKITAIATTVVSTRDFKAALLATSMDLVGQILTGELEARSADEASKVAERLIMMVTRISGMDLAEDISNIADPGVRAETLREFKRIAAERADSAG